MLLIRLAAAAIAAAAARIHHSNKCTDELFTHMKHFNFGVRKYVPYYNELYVSNHRGSHLCSSITGLCWDDLLRLRHADCWTSQVQETLESYLKLDKAMFDYNSQIDLMILRFWTLEN